MMISPPAHVSSVSSRLADHVVGVPRRRPAAGPRLLAALSVMITATAAIAQSDAKPAAPASGVRAGSNQADGREPIDAGEDARARDANAPTPADGGPAGGGDPGGGSRRLPLDGEAGRELALRNFRPESQLEVPAHPRSRAAFAVVDVHTHFYYRLRNNRQALDDFVDAMDRNGIAVCVSLDGKLGPQLEAHREYLWSDYKDRFVIYANIDWQGDGDADNPATWACHQPGFAERTARRLAAAVDEGVSGLKIFKRFGLGYRNPDGSLVEIDDPRWDPIWAACGELGIPVIIHTADPAAFFDPIDATNERWEELSRHPDWSFYGDEYPSREELLAARNRVIARHPETQFIGAHMANNPEDLATVSEWLARYPNLWVETASRIAELGRQPFTARDFLIEHADRVMFGTDGPQPERRLHLNWRFFETRDEYFPYSEKSPPPQGFWRIYGVDLPDPVLRKLYHENAAKLIPGVAERLEAYRRRRQADDASETGASDGAEKPAGADDPGSRGGRSE